MHDHHTHPLFYAAFRQAIDFSDVTELESACDLICDAADTCNVVLGHSWKDNFFVFDKELLERLPPCAIFNISLHNVAINSKAMELLSCEIGDAIKNLRDRDWYERNLQRVLNWFALLNGSVDGLVEFYEYLESVGVSSAEEMLLVDGVEIDWFEEAGLVHRTKFWADPNTWMSLSCDHKRKVHGIKLFTDGAFGARTAAISKPYLGVNDNFGMLIYEDSELAEIVEANSERGLALAVHAIGDRAIEQTIAVIERLGVVEKYGEIRIEHAQAISLQQAKRAKQLGIVLSMQPNFNIDSLNYADRLPVKFVEGNNPFRMLIDDVGFKVGEDLIFGSDGMPHGIQFAIEQATNPPFESQRMSIDELITGYRENN